MRLIPSGKTNLDVAAVGGCLPERLRVGLKVTDGESKPARVRRPSQHSGQASSMNELPVIGAIAPHNSDITSFDVNDLLSIGMPHRIINPELAHTNRASA